MDKKIIVSYLEFKTDRTKEIRFDLPSQYYNWLETIKNQFCVRKVIGLA